jgi:hypothetical protein
MDIVGPYQLMMAAVKLVSFKMINQRANIVNSTWMERNKYQKDSMIRRFVSREWALQTINQKY